MPVLSPVIDFTQRHKRRWQNSGRTLEVLEQAAVESRHSVMPSGFCEEENVGVRQAGRKRQFGKFLIEFLHNLLGEVLGKLHRNRHRFLHDLRHYFEPSPSGRGFVELNRGFDLFMDEKSCVDGDKRISDLCLLLVHPGGHPLHESLLEPVHALDLFRRQGLFELRNTRSNLRHDLLKDVTRLHAPPGQFDQAADIRFFRGVNLFRLSLHGSERQAKDDNQESGAKFQREPPRGAVQNDGGDSSRRFLLRKAKSVINFLKPCFPYARGGGAISFLTFPQLNCCRARHALQGPQMEVSGP